MKTLIGEVVADKMAKAVTVLLERRFRHPKYGKIINRHSRIHAVNEIGAKQGERVRMVECRPVSKTIRHQLVEVLVKDQTRRRSSTAAVKPGPTKKPRAARRKEKES